MINSLGSKKSRAKFYKKGYLPGDKRFRPILPVLSSVPKLRGQIFNGPTGVATITVESVRSFQ